MSNYTYLGARSSHRTQEAKQAWRVGSSFQGAFQTGKFQGDLLPREYKPE